MIQWLQKYSGTEVIGENIEKNELMNLRREIKHYKKKYEKEDQEIVLLSDQEEKESPEDQERIDEEIKKKHQKKKFRRSVISDEVLPEKDQQKNMDYAPDIEEKQREVYEKIEEQCKTLYLFKYLSDAELELIIQAFKTENYNKDDTIFSQGDNADKLYILGSGELECWKTFRKGDPPTYIKSFKEGDYFGELALMYNYKRNHTIKAKTSAVLYSLNRDSYKGIIQGSILRQREKFKAALQNVDILQNLTENEKGKVYDIMVEKEFKAGEEIIKQNENEDDFCILFEGNCHSEKASDTGKAPQVLKDFEQFDYFGDAPWFKCEPRNYSVKADSDCTLFIISRKEFKRLIDSLENILKRKPEVYQKFMKK